MKVVLTSETVKRASRGQLLGTRGRRLILAAASGSIGQAASNLGTFLTFPLVIRALGETRFGIYALVTAVAAMLPFADLGVGLAVVTELSSAVSRNDVRAARQIVSTAAAILLSCAFALLVSFGLLTHSVSWTGLLGARANVPASEVNQAITILVLFFALGLPASLGYKILFALQETHIANWWNIAAVPVMVVCVAVGHSLHMGVAWFVGSAIGVPSIVALCATLWVLGRHHRDFRPSITLVSRERARTLLRLGGVIAFQSLTMAIGYQSDAVVISHILGVREVALYSISMRVSSLATAFASVLFFGLWPAFSEALAKGDFDWTRKALRRAEAGAVALSMLFVIGMMLLGRPAIAMLSSNSIVPSLSLLLAISAWTIVRIVHYPLAVLLNAAGVGRFLVLCGLIMALVNILSSILLTHMFGVSGPAWGSAASVLVCSLFPAALYVRRLLSSSESSLKLASLAGKIT